MSIINAAWEQYLVILFSTTRKRVGRNFDVQWAVSANFDNIEVISQVIVHNSNNSPINFDSILKITQCQKKRLNKFLYF